MNKKVIVTPRWYGPVPTRGGKPLPKNQWARAGRKRKWTVRWYGPDGSRPRETFETKEEAEEFARTKTSEFESRGPQARIRPKKVTLEDFTAELRLLRIGPSGQRLSIGSSKSYQEVLTRFGKFVGPRTPLENITMADGIRYIASLRSGPSRRGRQMSTATINKHKRTLKAALNVAVLQLGYVNANPFTVLRQDKVGDQPLRYVSPEECAELIKACRSLPNKSLWWEAFITLCYSAGTRANEAIHVTWSDIDFENERVRIVAKAEIAGLEAWRPKDYDSRTIRIPSHTIALLSRLHSEADEGSEFVFVPQTRAAWIRSQRTTGRWTEGAAVVNNMTRDFKAIVRKAGILDATLHDLRRSSITHWAKRLAAPIVQELAGHADIKTTLKYYVTIRDEDLSEAADITARTLLSDPK